MKKIVRSFSILILLIFLSTTAFGCNNNDEFIEGKINITVAIKSDSSETSIMSDFKKAYERKNSNINIIIRPIIGSSYADAIFKFSTTEFPDLIYTGGDLHSIASSKGKFENLKPYFLRDDLKEEDFQTVAIESTRLNDTDDGIYFAPRDYNQLTVVFNKTIFEKAIQVDSTIKMPDDPLYYENGRIGWTWAEFYETCMKMRVVMDSNVPGQVNYDAVAGSAGLRKSSVPVEGQLGWNAVFYTIMRGFGADIYTENSLNDKKEVSLNTQAMKRASETIHTMWQNKLSNQSGLNVFFGGNASMYFTVRPTVMNLKNKKYTFDFAPFPVMETPVIGAGCSGYALSSESTNKEEAWKFLKFIMSIEGQNVIGESGAGFPVLKSLEDEGAWKSVISSNLNHQAFSANNKNAIGINYFNHLDSSLHGSVSQTMVDYVANLSKANYGEGSLDSLITKYENLLKAIK